MTTSEIINFIAIFVGPIIAVLISLWLQDRRETKQQKLQTFRTLMRTRRMRLSPEHVHGLNLVELEFMHNSEVMLAWKKYMENLDANKNPFPKDPDKLQAYLADRDSTLTKLLYQIGLSLGFRIEQLDILQGSYAPQAWEDDEAQLRHLRELMIEVMAGRRAVPIMPHNPNPQLSPYPPVPNGHQAAGI
ncbi:MAG: hypothetical protein H7X92_04150 [Chitinophagales bacterium]|nr:hypothetical protein [Hyphomicrobiales bacterium]